MASSDHSLEGNASMDTLGDFTFTGVYISLLVQLSSWDLHHVDLELASKINILHVLTTIQSKASYDGLFLNL